VLAIGIDAAESTLLRRMIEHDELPALRSLLADGKWLSVQSPSLIGSGAVWPTFLTGEEPANHGIYSEWKWLPESKAPALPGALPIRKPVWHAAWVVVRHPRGPVPKLTWIYAAGMLGFASMTSVLALYLGEIFCFTEETIGYVFLYVSTLSLVMRSVLLGPIVHRIGETGAMRVGTIVLFLGLVLYPQVHTLWGLAPVMALVPIGTALLFPATTALMSHATEKSELGTTMGVAQTFAAISRVIAPLMATSAFQRFGVGAPFYIAGGIVALVGVLAFRLEAEPSARPESETA